MEYFYSQVEPKFRDFGIIIICRDKQEFIIEMATIIKEICIYLKNQEKELIGGITMKRGKLNIKASLAKIIWMGLQ